MGNNLGCGCNCNGTGSGSNVLATLQTGDTFPLKLQYKDGNTVIPIERGYDVLVAFYDYKGNIITSGSINDGRLVYDENTSSYEMSITHDESLKMVGKVRVEVTLFSERLIVVDHADHVFALMFDNRDNNKLLHV